MTDAHGHDEVLDAVVVGAGFAGMYALIRLLGSGRTVLGLEAAEGVGGVWHWNRYPGARCDVESVDYSYSFDEQLQREWVWSERYATQPEIKAYAEHVASRYDLHRRIEFGCRVTSLVFDADDGTWSVTTDDGRQRRARFVFLATGSLSVPSVPEVPGLETFTGQTVMTARWPAEGVDFTGRQVGVIGTGSSGIQAIPLIARSSAALTVFQRSPNYTVPVLNRRVSTGEWARIQEDYPERRSRSWVSGAGTPHTAYPKDFWDIDDQERRAALETRWSEGGVLFGKTFERQTVDLAINDAAREFAEEKIRTIVRDPRIAADLIPSDHPIGTKRICTDDGYYETYNLPHVTLVNLRREPLADVTATGIRTAAATYDLDIIVMATGFDAMTGSFTQIDVRGPRGVDLADAWSRGPVTLLGVAIPGFPNLFTLTGPGSPSVLSNVVMAAEQQVDWLMALLDHCDSAAIRCVEATYDAAEAWTAEVNDVAERTLFTKAPSWYMGANIEGKARVFTPYLGGFKGYIDRCETCRVDGYAGFSLTT